MDPLSITVGCVSLIGAIAQVVDRVQRFMKNFREGRSQLLTIARQLEVLKRILDVLKHETRPSNAPDNAPTEAEELVFDQINSCFNAVQHLDSALHDIQQRDATAVHVSVRLAWTIRKAEVEKLSAELSKCIENLRLSIGISTR